MILIVDPSAERAASGRRVLEHRYGERHEVMTCDQFEGARTLVAELHDRGDHLAACLVAESGDGQDTDLLEVARAQFPEARRIVLCARAEPAQGLGAMNDALVHQYAIDDWSQPEIQIYPLLDDLLADWRAADRRTGGGVRVYGARWSPAAHEIKDFLARNQLPYHFYDVDHDATASAVVDRVTDGLGRTPVVLLTDGSALVEPDIHELAARVGLQTHATSAFYDLIVVGAGPAGLAAGVYGASEGLRVAVIEGEAPGGQAGTSSRIENYLGFPSGISGADLARRATEQVQRLGADLITATAVSSIAVEGDSKVVTLSDGEVLTSHALILTTGMTLRHLPAEGVERLTGAGVYYGAAPGEASEYTGSNVAVVGSANSAGQAAVMLSRYADHVTMLVRGESLVADMSQYLIRQIEDRPNIEVVTRTEVSRADGDDHLTGVELRQRDDGSTGPLAVSGLFIFIGGRPHSDLLRDIAALDDEGFVLTGADVERRGDLDPDRWHGRSPAPMETSVPGIFAAGDVRSGAVRRVASAVGQGSVCVSQVHQYLATR